MAHVVLRSQRVHADTPPSDANLAFASLLALQKAPELGTVWGTDEFVRLLPHPAPEVRWAAAQALSSMLALVRVRAVHVDIELVKNIF
jgi:hypothetical protein